MKKYFTTMSDLLEAFKEFRKLGQNANMNQSHMGDRDKAWVLTIKGELQTCALGSQMKPTFVYWNNKFIGGRQIVNILERHNFNVEWNGVKENAIQIMHNKNHR